MPLFAQISFSFYTMKNVHLSPNYCLSLNNFHTHSKVICSSVITQLASFFFFYSNTHIIKGVYCVCVFIYIYIYIYIYIIYIYIYTHIEYVWASILAYLHKLCVNTGYNLEDLLGVMDDRGGWSESHRNPCCQRELIMICIYTHIYIEILCMCLYIYIY